VSCLGRHRVSDPSVDDCLASDTGQRYPQKADAVRDGHLFHISLRSRCTVMLAGLRTLIQTWHGPDR
jgi:hypothetical protein